jgi:hypothetical protein
MKRWIDNQYLAMCRGSCCIQRQDRKLISSPTLAARARLLSFNRTQSRVVTGILTGHNTLRIHFYLMGLNICPLRRRCAAEDETSAHILCECGLRFHVHLNSFSLDPEDIKILSVGEVIWKFRKGTALP